MLARTEPKASESDDDPCVETELLAELLPQLRRFAAREIDSAEIDRRGEIPRALLESAARLGLFGLTIPRRYGGSGLGLSGACEVVGELARHDRSIAIMVGLHAGLGTRAIIEYGSDELRESLLPAMASGERVGAFCATEPGAGSDLMAIRTVASVEPGGVRVDGDKAYVTNGGFAGVYTVLARTPTLGGARAHSLVCVEREAPGVTVGAEEDKLGIRGSSTVTMHFDQARVSRDNVLGPGGKGMDEAYRALSWGRTIMASGCVGTARAALDATVQHVRARRQFGRPIGEFTATRAHVAEMAARLFAMESLVRETAWQDALGAGVELESMQAKVLCSEGAFAVCDAAVQLHGALGFIEPVGVAMLLRDCRITRIFEGANDVLLVRAGVALLAGAARPSAGTPSADGLAPPEGARYMREACERLERELAAAITRARKEHGIRVVHQQLLLQRIARAAVCLAGASAAMRRAARADGVSRALGEHAVELLALEGERHLEDARRSHGDELRAALVSGLLYGESGATKGATQ